MHFLLQLFDCSRVDEATMNNLGELIPCVLLYRVDIMSTKQNIIIDKAKSTFLMLVPYIFGTAIGHHLADVLLTN